jgi:hypothetical protein
MIYFLSLIVKNLPPFFFRRWVGVGSAYNIIFVLLSIPFFSFGQKSKKTDFEVYKTYIQGDLDNSKQVAEQVKAGKQIHPYAKHVNRLLDSKIKNLPDNYKGFYILEESYYKYPDKDTIAKPYIFWFEPSPIGEVILHSIQIPERYNKKDIKNSNPNLSFDYNELRDSPSFKPATYTRTKNGFYIKAPNELPNGMRFTLEETIGKKTFEVMELLEKDGKSLTPYNTPLIYKRIK